MVLLVNTGLVERILQQQLNTLKLLRGDDSQVFIVDCMHLLQSREFHRPLSGSSTAHFQVSVMQDTDEAATALLVHTTADATQDDFDIIEAQVIVFYSALTLTPRDSTWQGCTSSCGTTGVDGFAYV